MVSKWEVLVAEVARGHNQQVEHRTALLVEDSPGDIHKIAQEQHLQHLVGSHHLVPADHKPALAADKEVSVHIVADMVAALQAVHNTLEPDLLGNSADIVEAQRSVHTVRIAAEHIRTVEDRVAAAAAVAEPEVVQPVGTAVAVRVEQRQVALSEGVVAAVR